MCTGTLVQYERTVRRCVGWPCCGARGPRRSCGTSSTCTTSTPRRRSPRPSSRPGLTLVDPAAAHVVSINQPTNLHAALVHYE